MMDSDVLTRVRRALGRPGGGKDAPIPPELPEHIVRLVQSEIGLPELFARRGGGKKKDVGGGGGGGVGGGGGGGVVGVRVEELVGKVVEYLRGLGLARIALPKSLFLERLGVVEGLKRAGLEARTWDEMTLDELYDYDAGLTDVYAAVAETGSLVIK